MSGEVLRRVRDLVPGDEVASGDGSRTWIVESAEQNAHGGLWHVRMRSGDRTYEYDRYHPDELAPRPRAVQS